MQKTTLKKWLFCLFMFLFSVLIAFPFSTITASADMGPKPSVRVTFENMRGELCYGTLLSQKRSTGPYSVWDGDEEHLRDYLIDDLDVWKKFLAYQDEDGYYFLQWADKVENNEIAWTYYPPSNFKVLLYYPNTDTFVASEIYERYAFDSYYTIDVNAMQNGKMVARQSYDYTQEIISLVIRILLTIAVEIVVAWLLGFRSAKEILLLILVNTLTQVGLNLYLNNVLYFSGSLAFFFSYINGEIFVFIGEAILYCLLLPRVTDRPKWKIVYVLYALIANLLSFFLGVWLAEFIPQIF